jgi:hypothetical protein
MVLLLMRKLLLIGTLLLCTQICQAQITQVIKGTVADKDSKAPITGVAISVVEDSTIVGRTDENGNFMLSQVGTGSFTILFTHPSHRPYAANDVLVASGRQTVLYIEMEDVPKELITLSIKAKKKTLNEMSVVSTRLFDVQETERYAGSRGDPARMASNFAGVQGADDSRNDIVVRGNSPQGVLWRLEGVDIPNPNHFNIPGTTGGPVSMLNNKMLANSEFHMGAFAAEYGNSTSAVFDLNLRNGNNSRYEVSTQFGFLGTEVGVEGPLKAKKGSSFLLNYRYSTLKLFESLNIKIGTNSVPAYQDGSFKINLPINAKTKLGIWGLAGTSKIDLIVSNIDSIPTELYGENDRDQYFKSNLAIIGSTLQHQISNSKFLKLSVAYSSGSVFAMHEKVFRDSLEKVTGLKPILNYAYRINTLHSHLLYNYKINSSLSLRAGIVNNLYMVSFQDSSRQYPPTRTTWLYRNNYAGATNLAQAYVQLKIKPSAKLTITPGLHAQILTHNGSASLEPRIGARYTAGAKSNITIGYGLHSQMQQLYQYFAQIPDTIYRSLPNIKMGFTRTHHIVTGYDYALTNTISLRAEAYYQRLFNIPIETRLGSSFNALNQGGSFSRLFPDSLTNNGVGYNYGLELTISKALKNNYYYLINATVYNSKAKGADGVFRNTDYNSNFITNGLFGYNVSIGKNSTLILGTKVSFAGGQRYSAPDIAASNALGDLVIIDSTRNSLQFKNYFRQDLKLGYRINRKKVSHELGLDLVNVFGTKNLLQLTYSPDLAAQGKPNPFFESYQLGFLPLFYYRTDFGFGQRQ